MHLNRQRIPKDYTYMNYTGDVCLEFQYYLYGPTIGSIRVYSTVVGTPPDQGERLWREGEYSNQQWQSAYIRTHLSAEYDVCMKYPSQLYILVSGPTWPPSMMYV